MENIAVVFGGKSVEHDISVITALQVMHALPKKYNLVPLYIRQDGVMVTADNLTDGTTFLNYAKFVKKEKPVSFQTGFQGVTILNKRKAAEKIKLDGAILCNHGHGGEDGSLQGLLEMCGIPYSSPNVACSAVCMDKALTKAVLKENDVLTPAYVNISKCEYTTNAEEFLFKVGKELGYPCIVKPARCGSSVGISTCESEAGLSSCVQNAFQFDDKVIVEEYIENAREFFCAVVQLSGKKLTGRVDEAVKERFYTFEEKYLEKKKVEKVKVGKNLESEVKVLAKKVYSFLDCKGVVRIDFLFDDKAKLLYVNEVNTIPGSLAFNLFDNSFQDLLNAIVIDMKQRKEGESKLVYQFNSNAIEKYLEMKETGKRQK